MRASRTVRFFSPTAAAATAFLNRLDLHCFLPLASDRHNVQGLLASNGTEGLFSQILQNPNNFQRSQLRPEMFQPCENFGRNKSRRETISRSIGKGKGCFLLGAAGFGRRLAICWSQRLAEWVAGSWLPVAAYWIELGGRVGHCHWSPNQTLLLLTLFSLSCPVRPV